MSQCKQILEHLQSGKTLTGIEALTQFGCFRLAARICDLREAGHPIVSETINDHGKTYCRYSYLGAA